MPTVKIDGREISVPEGTRIIEAADMLGVPIPRFCYHPGLSVAANCRMCLVETNKSPKLVPSCYELCQEGMEVSTRSEKVRAAQKAVLEFILLHHPVDCPICDQAGECDLQDLYFQYSCQPSRHNFRKRHKPKAKVLGPNVVYDGERCINCTRCIRFCNEVAKAPQLCQVHRGERTYIDVFPGQALDNPYSMCTADICPVGALTTRDFRFKCRVWFLSGIHSVCPECSRNCSVRVDTFRNRIFRVVPRYNPQVNVYWACDAGRLAFHRYEEGRASGTSVRGGISPYQEALKCAYEALKTGPICVVLSPFLTCEDVFACAKVLKGIAPDAQFFIGGRQDGFEDDILIRKDKNPNRRGLETVLRGLGIEAKILESLTSAAPRILVVFGDENAEDSRVLEAARACEAVILFSTLHKGLRSAATVAFSVVSPYETDGTFLSEFGVLQRVRQAVRPPEGVTEPWRIMLDLADLAGLPLAARGARGLFAAMSAQVSDFSGLSWENLGEFGAVLGQARTQEQASQVA